MKKVILGVLALIFSVALVIGGYMLISSRTLQEYAVEEGVTCPYSWQELRDGRYRLKINTSAYPDGSWGVECYPKNVAAVAEESSETGMVVFSILPMNAGQAYVQVYCEQTDPIAVRLFEIGMQISVSEDRKITVEKTEHKHYNGTTKLNEDGEDPIQWWTDPNGAVNILVTGEGGGSWKVVDYDSESLDVTGPFFRQDSCGFEIRGKLVGTFPMTIYDGGTKAICMEIAVAEDLNASISSAVADTYVPDMSVEHAALEAAAGRALVLPLQAVATDYYVNSSAGQIEFLLNDLPWTWQIFSDGAIEDLTGEFAANAEEIKTDDSGSAAGLSAYRASNCVVAVWSDGGYVMVLYGEAEVALTDALAVARLILEANNG